ncbi:MAG TPA: transketolase [Armatimonadetes bacterium]|nr:transketolase [Armatimonadota bacterium]
MNQIDELCINTLRFLSADAVQEANSGHPGLPLGAAPMAYTLFDRVMRFDPADPGWINRDRFILSAGHGSALLYALLHSYGYDLPLEQVRNFRQWESLTPGHPEYGLTPGVEATTGPLGQGFAMGVGMAMAERFLAAQFNTSEQAVIDHYTYAIVSDGDLMEGISAEAASLAGHQKLGKLIYLYDDNSISIEGSTDLAFTEDVCARFAAYGWHVQTVADGNDVDAIEAAVKAAQTETGKPSLIAVKTHIGYGSPKQDSAKAHGEPLGDDDLAATKEKLGWPVEPRFHVPEDAAAHMLEAGRRGGQLHKQWNQMLEAYRAAAPEQGATFDLCVTGQLPAGWDEALPVFEAGGGDATRNSSGKVLNALAGVLPTLIGGSADLAPSNKTMLDGFDAADAEHPGGRNFHFGVREHAMGAAVNGMALHGGVIPYGGTFLVFSDYVRPSLRLASLMQTHAVFVFTHDSIGVGEDGPTHQPIEHVMSLRAIPELLVLRPADPNETAAAWRVAIERGGPACLMLTRQKLPTLDPAAHDITGGVAKGAYVLRAATSPDIVLIATGSEVSLALKAAEELAAQGIEASVVSMPSWELFEEQDDEYRKSVLPCGVPRVSIEAGTTLGWQRYVGLEGDAIGLDRFGASAPGDEVMEKLGLNVENVVCRVKKLLGR